MASRFDYRPELAASGLGLMGAQTGPIMVAPGWVLAQGSFGCLVRAELFAAHAGVVPFVELADGQTGVAQIGGARDVLDTPAKWHRRDRVSEAPAVRAIYLAAHGSVRRAHDSATTTSRTTPLTVPDLQIDGIGALPALVVPLLCIGVAAIVAGAYYATRVEETRIQVAGDNTRQVSRVALASEMATKEMALTGRVPSELWAFLRAEADAEASKGSALGGMMPLLVGAGVLGLGFAAWRMSQVGIRRLEP